MKKDIKVNADVRTKVLSVGIDSTDMSGVLRKIDEIIQVSLGKPFFLVTAYSESLLEAKDNDRFRNALQKADSIVADGVSVAAAMDYVAKPGWMHGLGIGGKVLRGGYYEKLVPGVKLARITLESGEYKVFLLGGWDGVACKLAQKYGCDYDEGPEDLGKLSEAENQRIVEKINKAKPDIVLVAMGRFRQEIWIADNLDKLRCKVIVGVGSAFDELVGEGKWAIEVPKWVEKAGLKWLWRAIHDPKHWARVWRAVVVFPLKVMASTSGR